MARVPVANRVTVSGRVAVSGRSAIPARQNYIIAPNDLTAAAWTKIQVTITADADAGPSASALDSLEADVSSLPLDAMIPSVVNTSHIVAQVGFGSYFTSRRYTMGVIAKAGNLYGILMSFSGGADAGWFDLQTGVVGFVSSSLTSSITSLGSGYYLCQITGGQFGGGASNANVYLAPASGGVAFAGDGVTPGAYVGGIQLVTANRLGPLTTTGTPLTPAIRWSP